MNHLNLLLVDDDDLIHQALKITLPEQWKLTSHRESENLPKGPFHAALVDMHLTQKVRSTEGIGVIKSLREAHPHLEIIAISGHLDREVMEECLRAGATRFLAKPLSPKEVQLCLDKIEAYFLLKDVNQSQMTNKVRWIGKSEVSKKIHLQIAQLRSEAGPILIYGESGTGKEVTSVLLNQQEGGHRPFVQLNVAAIPETLFESEFFGHVRGAFTGADQNKMGLAEAAHGGDLFLDEIEALSLPLQVKLLRFLETQEIRRVGDQKTIKVSARVIAATNRDLDEMVKNGEFREDLLWRLKGKTLILPPLRDRQEDIVLIAENFLRLDQHRKKVLDQGAIEVLKSYKWPGNVRELKRICEQLLLYSPLPIIRKEDVQAILQNDSMGEDIEEELSLEHGLSEVMNRYESKILKKAIGQFDDIEKLIAILKISRSGFYKKIKDYGIALK